MRLVGVDALRLRLSATDAGSVMAKLAGYLNSATLYLEAQLETSFPLIEDVRDIFYLDPYDPMIKMQVHKLMLSQKFVNGTTLVVKAYGSFKDAVKDQSGSTVDATAYHLDSDKGVLHLLDDFSGSYLCTEYNAGFAIKADNTYGDIVVNSQDDVPDWLEEAALATAARLYQVESRELDVSKADGLWADVSALIYPHKRMHVSSFKPMVV